MMWFCMTIIFVQANLLHITHLKYLDRVVVDTSGHCTGFPGMMMAGDKKKTFLFIKPELQLRSRVATQVT